MNFPRNDRLSLGGPRLVSHSRSLLNDLSFLFTPQDSFLHKSLTLAFTLRKVSTTGLPKEELELCVSHIDKEPVLSQRPNTLFRLVKKLLLFWSMNFKSSLGSNASLLIKRGTITINRFLLMRIKFVISCSMKIHTLEFDELSKSIVSLLLVVEAFSLQKVVKMLNDRVVD